MGFKKLPSQLADVWIIKPDVFGDERGFFMELYNKKSFDEIGLGHLNFVQDNLSSSARGTLRGMHFQTPPHSQGKLITVLQGTVLDVAVDLRKGSPTFGQYEAFELDANTPTSIFIPKGMAHGFQVLSESCLFLYKCTQLYHKSSDGGIAWNDPSLAIPWRDIPPLLSEKDKNHPPLNQFDSPFQYKKMVMSK